MSSKFKPQYTGTMQKGSEPNTIIGVIRDVWGWEIQLHGTLVNGTYALTGTLGEVPEALRIPAIDGVR